MIRGLVIANQAPNRQSQCFQYITWWPADNGPELSQYGQSEDRLGAPYRATSSGEAGGKSVKRRAGWFIWITRDSYAPSPHLFPGAYGGRAGSQPVFDEGFRTRDAGILASHTDATVLESPEIGKDLPCAVTAIRPELGFDLSFHSGYEVTVPLRELAGSGNSLTAIFRVSPATHPGKPIYFWQTWDVPPIGEDTQGAAHLRGELVQEFQEKESTGLSGSCAIMLNASAPSAGRSRPNRAVRTG